MLDDPRPTIRFDTLSAHDRVLGIIEAVIFFAAFVLVLRLLSRLLKPYARYITYWSDGDGGTQYYVDWEGIRAYRRSSRADGDGLTPTRSAEKDSNKKLRT